MERLAAAMREVNARIRAEGLSDEEAKALPIPLDGRWLSNQEISTRRTDIGKIDVLMNIPVRDGTRLTYNDLAGRAAEMRVGDITIHVDALGQNAYLSSPTRPTDPGPAQPTVDHDIDPPSHHDCR